MARIPKPVPLAARREISVGRESLGCAELTPDGREVLVGGFSGVYTIDVGSGNVARRYRKYERNVVHAARMTLDGTRVVAGNGGARLDVWDAKTTKRIFELDTDDRIVTRLTLSRDGKRAATAAGNNTLRFWDIEHGVKLAGRIEKKSFVIAAAIAPSGAFAMHGGTDGVVRVFDLASEKEIASGVGKGWIESIDCAADGTAFISAGRDKTIMIWDPSAVHLRTLRGFTRTIYCAHISPDGRRVLATGGGAPMVWDAANGKVLGTLSGDGVYSARFSHDGASIVSLSNGFVRIHDTP